MWGYCFRVAYLLIHYMKLIQYMMIMQLNKLMMIKKYLEPSNIFILIHEDLRFQFKPRCLQPMQIKSFLCLEQPNVLVDQNLHPWLLLTSNNFNILELSEYDTLLWCTNVCESIVPNWISINLSKIPLFR